MENKFSEINLKPLEQRKAEISNKIRAKINAETFTSFREDMATDLIKYPVIAAMLGRELWEEYWAVLKDTIEAETNEMLDKIESRRGNRGRQKGLFE